MRGWMNEGRSYIAPVGIGKVMRAGAVGRVIASKHTGFAVGDHVYGRFGVQEYAPSKGDGVTKVDPIQAPLPVFLGTLGLPGMTAYFGLLDAALANLARNARIVICGAISQYNNTSQVKGPSNYLSLLVNRASMTGMVIFDYADRYHEATSAIAGWIAAGKLKSREDIVAGFATFPETLLTLFAGENFGKLVLQVADV
jgi:NADPH-dependent curcumin reductase CurA